MRVAPAQLGCADSLLPAQGNGHAASAYRRAGRTGCAACRESRHRSLVQSRCRRTAGRRGGSVRQDEGHAGCLVRFRHYALARAARLACRRVDLSGRSLPRRLRPASRLVPVFAALRLCHRRSRALQGAVDAWLRRRWQGTQNVEVQGQRHRAAAGFRQDGADILRPGQPRPTIPANSAFRTKS